MGGRPIRCTHQRRNVDLRVGLCASKAAGEPASGIGCDAPLRGVRCGARIEVVPHNSQRSLRRATLKQDAADQSTKHAGTRADLNAALLAAAYSPRHWPARSLAGPPVHLDHRTRALVPARPGLGCRRARL